MGIPPVTGGFPHNRAINVEIPPCHDVTTRKTHWKLRIKASFPFTCIVRERGQHSANVTIVVIHDTFILMYEGSRPVTESRLHVILIYFLHTNMIFDTEYVYTQKYTKTFLHVCDLIQYQQTFRFTKCHMRDRLIKALSIVIQIRSRFFIVTQSLTMISLHVFAYTKNAQLWCQVNNSHNGNVPENTIKFPSDLNYRKTLALGCRLISYTTAGMMETLSAP